MLTTSITERRMFTRGIKEPKALLTRGPLKWGRVKRPFRVGVDLKNTRELTPEDLNKIKIENDKYNERKKKLGSRTDKQLYLPLFMGGGKVAFVRRDGTLLYERYRSSKTAGGRRAGKLIVAKDKHVIESGFKRPKDSSFIVYGIDEEYEEPIIHTLKLHAKKNRIGVIELDSRMAVFVNTRTGKLISVPHGGIIMTHPIIYHTILSDVKREQ